MRLPVVLLRWNINDLLAMYIVNTDVLVAVQFCGKKICDIW